MAYNDEKLWPFSKTAAILIIPIVWILFAILFSLTQKYANWPDTESRNLVMIVVFVFSFIPLALVLLAYFQRHGATVDVKGLFKIAFSQIDISRTDIRRESFSLPENIGFSGPIQADATPMNIIEALKKATENEIIVVDLKEGNAWWVTRLLALSAGAVRAGSPNAFVFVEKKGNVSHTFLGWAEPKDILRSILNDKGEYKSRYQKSMRIAKQVFMYGANELLPQQPATFIPHNDIRRYLNQNFANLGEAVSEQILMDQLAISGGDPLGSLEEVPDRLTNSRFKDLFGHCLHDDAIDLNQPNEKQISIVLKSKPPYIALVRNGKYESMLKREDVERLIIRELFSQVQQENR